MAQYSIKTSGGAGSAQKLPKITQQTSMPTTANSAAASQLKLKGTVQGTSATSKSLG